jgi:tetratricopeptide (TPR) repeat protein
MLVISSVGANGRSIMDVHHRVGILTTAALFAFAVGVAPALSEGDPRPTPPAPSTDTKSGSGGKSTKSKKQKQSEQKFLDGYRQAYNLIQTGRYADGIAAMHALGHDEHPDVANYIGYASRKLGNYEDAKYWYEKALAADPNHVRTYQYFAMWYLEQGTRLKAQDYLVTIRTLCGGTACKEYVSLQDALNGNMIY